MFPTYKVVIVDKEPVTLTFGKENPIHPDDSLRTVKQKILLELHESKKGYAFKPHYENMYLYAYVSESTTLTQLFESAEGDLKRSVVEQLLDGHPEKEAILGKLPDDPVQYADLAVLLSDTKQIISRKTALGVRFQDRTFEVDPFLVDRYKAYQTEHYDMVHVDTQLLLNYGNIVENTLYLCLSDRVLSSTSNEQAREYISRYYFPLLQTTGKKDAIKDIVGKKHLFDSIRTFYELSAAVDADSPVQYSVRGIQSAVLRVANSIKNLEMVFKLIHASKDAPFIKYNPGSRRENLYRLYFDRVSRNGKKTPYLSKTHLSKLAKETGKSQHLSIAIETPHFAHLYLHLEPTGGMLIDCAMRSPITEKELHELILSEVNPRLETWNLDGVKIAPYTDMRETEVVAMEYVLRAVDAKSQVDLAKIPCIYSVCTLNVETPGKPPVARMKRVENFRDMDAANILISELYGEVQYGELEIGDIVDALVHRKLMTTREDAMMALTEYLNRREQVSLEKPGFLLTVQVDPAEKTVEYRVSGITSIYYLDSLFVYLDAFTKLTQTKTAGIKHYTKQLKAYCAKIKPRDLSTEESGITVAISRPLRPSTQVDLDFFANLGIEDEDAEPVGANTYKEFDTELEPPESDPKAVDELLTEFHKSPAKGPILYSDSEDDEAPVKEKEAPAKGPILYSDSEDEPDLTGGAEEEEEVSAPLLPDGQPLKNPSPFLLRLQKRDPALFFTNPKGKFSGFSTACQPVSRHPVILNQEEMDKMPKDAYSHAIKYGSDPEKPHYFVCPRFWCFLTNSAISEEDVKAGKCGKIIPKGSKTIPKGAYVYELSEKDQIPSYQLDAHPDGHCLPCCFKKSWDSKPQRDMRAVCDAKMSNPTGAVVAEKRAMAQKTSQYIISLDTYPVPEKRWGYLPLPVQLFLNMDYSKSVDPNNHAMVIKGVPVLLRYGVEHFPKQSFLGLFADVMARERGESALSVAEFRDLLTSKITLDVFAQANNASLLSEFMPKKRPATHPSTKKYETTMFAQGLDTKKDAQRAYLIDAILAYESFLSFLRDKTVPIDHTYLWDIFTSGVLFREVNLVMMEIKSNDMLERIELVCPNITFSSRLFDQEKDTILVLKHGEFYEPIFSYESAEKSGAPTIVHTFSANSLHKNIKDVLKNVERMTQKFCPALPSLPRIYTFRDPLPLKRVVEQAESLGAKVEKQVLNYQGKTIAVLAKMSASDAAIWLPCAPSARRKGLAVDYMDNEELWQSYETTVRLLSQFQTKLPVKPQWKIREDGLVVGFLTETNQFVPIQPNQDIVMDDIRLYEGVSAISIDKAFSSGKGADKTRREKAKHIQLETEFYHVFRNKLRDLTNHLSNVAVKTRMQALASAAEIEPLLKSLAKGHVVFVDIGEDVLLDLSEVNECVGKETPYCIVKENGASQLALPKNHLLSKLDNEVVYYGRLADELARNERVKAFFYDVKTRISAKSVDYSIRADEFVLPQSAFTAEYFAELDPPSLNPYVQQTDRDSAMPSIYESGYLNETVPLEEQYTEAAPILSEFPPECVSRVSKVIGNAQQIWKRIFPADTTKEVVFHATPECTFVPFASILSGKLGKPFDTNEVKRYLCIAYAKYSVQDLGKMCSIMRVQGKSRMFESLVKRKDRLSMELLEEIIMSDTYFMTDMDVWVLATEYVLPIVLFNPNGLKGFVRKNVNWLKMGGGEDYYFVRSNIGSVANKVYPYHLILPATKLSGLKEFYAQVLESMKHRTESTWSLKTMMESTVFV